MTYHKFWKGLNRYPNEPHGRWDNSYVLKTEWSLYHILGFKWLIIFTPFLPMYLLLQLPSSMLDDKSGIGVIILLSSLASWYVLGIWKLLPYLLKKYNIIAYYPKTQSQDRNQESKS